MSELRRELGLGGAIVTGLGSILGTGVFVSIAVASGFADRWVILAAPIAGLVATFNGLSSAQLAAAHPVAGGTYEYGYRFVDPWLGFAAGWLFLVAKSASAATAATGVAAYALDMFGADSELRRWLAIAVAVSTTAAVAAGVRRTTRLNAVLVSFTIISLAIFVFAGVLVDQPRPQTGAAAPPSGDLLTAVAFLFVAYTGYGRIATLGEEVRRPAWTIPRAVVATLVITTIIYTAVAAAGWAVAGTNWAEGVSLASLIPAPYRLVVEIGAITAMLGVLVNLVLGLSRVWLAMGRRNDMPESLARISPNGSPTVAVLVAGTLVAGIAFVDDIRVTWSFSAFAVLLYYATTNLAALRLPVEYRRFPRALAWAGLGSCIFLSFWVPAAIWLFGVAVVAGGLVWRVVWHKRRASVAV